MYLWAILGEVRAEIEASGDDKRILLRRIDNLRTKFRNIDAYSTHRVTDILQVVKKEILCPKAIPELVDVAIAQSGFVLLRMSRKHGTGPRARVRISITWCSWRKLVSTETVIQAQCEEPARPYH